MFRFIAAGLLLASLAGTAHADTYSTAISRKLDDLQSKCAYMGNDPKAPACVGYKAALASTIPPDVKALMQQEEGFDNQCRNGAPPKLLANGQYAPGSACAQREQLMKSLHQRSWCWGHTDMDSYHPGWVICHAGEWQ